MKNTLKNIWKDPVGSNIISVLIIGVLSIVYNSLKAFYRKTNFETTFIDFWTFKLGIWQYILFSIVIIVLLYLFQRFKNKKTDVVDCFKDYDFNEISNPIDKYDEDSRRLDTENFNKIRNEILQSNTSIYWLRHQNFAGFGFKSELTDPFYNFENECDTNPNFTFLNSEIEEKKQDLHNYIKELTTLISLNTFPEENGIQILPPEWEDEQPERFFDTVKKFNTVRENVILTYDEFIKLGRKILKV